MYRGKRVTSVGTTEEPKAKKFIPNNNHQKKNKMPPFHILVWCYLKLLNLLLLPAIIARLFYKPRTLPPIENQILFESATSLADKLRKQELTSEAVVKAYIGRILEVNPILNAVIDERFTDALEEAKKADSLIRKLSIEQLKTNYPLLGVPLTVKGSISVAGLRNTSGLVNKNEIEEVDATALKRAREAGAIPLCTTNVPELCVNYEAINKLIGTTSNPYNTTRTVGGSSGGEACLLSAAASVIGIGSDVGGSLRLPAHFCGVFGHKPTPGVVSFKGHYPGSTSDEEWRAIFTLGPMTRYAEDLPLLLSLIAEPAEVEKLSLFEPVDFKNLKFYYMDDLDLCLMDSPNQNVLSALRSVMEHFTNNHDAKFKKIEHKYLKFSADITHIKLITLPQVDNLFKETGEGALGELFRWFTCRSKATYTAIMVGVMRRYRHRIPKNTIQKCNEMGETLKEHFTNILGSNGVLLAPTYPIEAHYHGDAPRKLFNCGFMSLFNVIGFPATNFPVNFTKENLPIGIQAIAAPYNDRLALAVAQEIEKAFGGWKPPCMKETLANV